MTKNIFKAIISLLIINYSFVVNVNAQVGINSTNANPDNSAMLDVSSTDKGVLIPRMTTAQRNLINTPANGLMIYNATDSVFNYYNGTAWTDLSSGVNNQIADTDNDTKITVEKTTDEDSIRFDIMGSERLVIRQNSNGMTLLSLPNSNANTFLGKDAGANTYLANNTFLGYHSGKNTSNGSFNTFVGAQSGLANSSGTFNVFIGAETGFSNTSGTGNVFLGNTTGYDNTTGGNNLFIGNSAGRFNSTGQNNVYLGALSGLMNISGSNNVFLGHTAGQDETGSNKLYIENTNSSTPLIYGDFANDTVKIYGTLGIKDAYHFPVVDGTTGQFLKTDGNGQLSWADENGDNLGNHTATQNIQLGANRISADGDNEGILISNTGQVGIGKMSTLNDLFQVTKEIPTYSDITTPSTSVTTNLLHSEVWRVIDNKRVGIPWVPMSLPTWIKLDLGHPQTVTSYAIQCQPFGVAFTPNNNLDFKDWTFEGSNDNTNWTVLDSKSNFTFTTFIDTFMLSSPADYQYYRLNGMRSGTNVAILTEVELFGLPNVDVLAVTDAGDIRFNNAYVFPNGDGTVGQFLKTDGNGQLSWGNLGNKNNTYGQGVFIEVNNSAGTRALFGADGSGFAGGDTTDVILANWSNGDLALLTNAAERMRITATGEVGIGRKPMTNLLEVNGQASKATAGSWVANSDARLKKNITPLSSEKMLHNLLSLQGVTYEWNDHKTGNDRPAGIQYGFTAQNIQTVFPTLVQEDNLGYLQTAYGTYDAMTVEAIRALNDKIERQGFHIQQLVKEKEALKTQIAKMTQQQQEIAKLKAAVQALQGQMEE